MSPAERGFKSNKLQVHRGSDMPRRSKCLLSNQAADKNLPAGLGSKRGNCSSTLYSSAIALTFGRNASGVMLLSDLVWRASSQRDTFRAAVVLISAAAMP